MFRFPSVSQGEFEVQQILKLVGNSHTLEVTAMTEWYGSDVTAMNKSDLFWYTCLQDKGDSLPENFLLCSNGKY